MGGPENLNRGSIRPSVHPSIHPSTLAQPIKSVCFYFPPIESPVHPGGGRSDWSFELPSLITLDRVIKIYPGVSVCFKPRGCQTSLERARQDGPLVGCVVCFCGVLLPPNFLCVVCLYCQISVSVSCVLAVVLPQKFCEFVMCVYRVSVAKIL